jgi:hypothetical protein
MKQQLIYERAAVLGAGYDKSSLKNVAAILLTGLSTRVWAVSVCHHAQAKASKTNKFDHPSTEQGDNAPSIIISALLEDVLDNC